SGDPGTVAWPQRHYITLRCAARPRLRCFLSLPGRMMPCGPGRVAPETASSDRDPKPCDDRPPHTRKSGAPKAGPGLENPHRSFLHKRSTPERSEVRENPGRSHEDLKCPGGRS